VLIEAGRDETVVQARAPALLSAGARARGEYHCADCGYGIVTARELPVCPMCGAASWEPSSTSPFARIRT
jgi:rubrerythrin